MVIMNWVGHYLDMDMGRDMARHSTAKDVFSSSRS